MAGHSKRKNVAVIGAGERGVYVLGARTAEMAAETGLVVRVLCDINQDRAREGRDYLLSLYQKHGVAAEIELEDDFRAAIHRDDIDIVFVTNFTSGHREPAVEAIRAGKQVYLDKPMATTLEDAEAIVRAERSSSQRLIMGFTRRYEHSWRSLVDLLRDGTIGKLQTILLRSVIPYARYLQRWHRDQKRSGGALNDKVSHYFDALNWIAGAPPESLHADGGRSEVFAPDPTAPARCRECDRICPFRALPSETVPEIGTVYKLDPDYKKQDVGIFSRPSWRQATTEDAQIDNCVFSPDVDIIDHALVTIRYQNGVKASLFWNIFGPSADDEETIELVGASGRARLERGTGRIDVVSDYGAHTELRDARGPHFGSSHFGADIELLREIKRHGEGAEPIAGTEDGLLSLRMVLATEESIASGGRPIHF